MNTNPKIIINSAPGKNPEDTDGNDLLECYFQRTEHGNGTYHLHGKDGEKIKTEPHHFKNGEGFTFKLGELEWSVTKLSIWSIEEDPPIWFATGDWKAHNKTAEDDPETGTFQGQSGGGPEYAATESASA